MLWYTITVEGTPLRTVKPKGRFRRFMQTLQDADNPRTRISLAGCIQPKPGVTTRDVYDAVVEHARQKGDLWDGSVIILNFFMQEDYAPVPLPEEAPAETTGVLTKEDIGAMVRAADTPEAQEAAAVQLRAASQRLHDVLMKPRPYDPADNHDAETLADQGDLDGLPDPDDPDSAEEPYTENHPVNFPRD